MSSSKDGREINSFNKSARNCSKFTSSIEAKPGAQTFRDMKHSSSMNSLFDTTDSMKRSLMKKLRK